MSALMIVNNCKVHNNFFLSYAKIFILLTKCHGSLYFSFWELNVIKVPYMTL
jgi:hypothetical protein